MNTPLSMFITGMIIAGSDVKGLVYNKNIWYIIPGASPGDSGGVLWRIFAVSCDRHGGAGGTFAGSLPERGGLRLCLQCSLGMMKIWRQEQWLSLHFLVS